MKNDDQSVDLRKKKWVAIPYVTIYLYVLLFIPIVQSIFIMFSVHSFISSFDSFVCYFETSGLAFSAMAILNSTEGSLSKISVCLKIGYIPNYSHLIGIMIINHWV